MKKFFHATILAFMAMVCGQALATTVVFDPASDLGAQEGSSTGEDQVTKDGITISASPTGSFGNGQQYRVYKGSTFTVSSTVGNITSISFTCTAKDDAKYGPGCFTDCSSGNYTYSGNDGNWSGDAAQVSWVASTNQVRMTSITVEVGAPEPQQLSISGNTPFKGSTTVTITPSNPDFAVYYTTDNSDPVSSSTAKLYTSPFTLTETTTVKAYEEDYDGNESAVVEKTFVKEESAGTGSGTLSDPFNAVAANDLASTLEVGQVTDESYYIKGKISSIRYTFSAQYGTATFYISDDGTESNQFYIYATYFLENKSWVEGNTQIKVGDDVIIYGKITNYNGTLETASKESYIYSLNGKTSEDAVTPEEPEPTGNGTLQDPFNAVAANNLAATLEVGQVTDESYYIKGKISSIRYTFSEQYGTATFYISDDGAESNQFCIYATYYLENKSWVEGNTQIKVGDDVIICGKITNYNGTYETASKESYIYSLNGETSDLTVIATDIAQFKAFEEGQEGILTLDNAQVLYVGTRDVYVRDATGAIDFYNLGLTFEAGQILNGIIQGKKATYNDLPELTKTDQTNDDGFTREADTALPVFLTIAEARNPQYYCDLVRIQDVKLKAVETESGAVNYYAYAGDDELQVYDKFGLSINFAELTNDDYTFTFQGILVPWRGDYELYVTEVNYTSGIQQITEDADMATPRYNTAGQRVDKSYKGIVIQNGSKYIVK